MRGERTFGSKPFYLLLTIMLVGAIGFLFLILIGTVSIARDEREQTCDVFKEYITDLVEPYQDQHGELFRRLNADQRRNLLRLNRLRDDLPC